MSEAVASDFGDTHGLWSQLLDPNNTGAVSRSEFIAEIGEELGLTTAQARLVFSVLDTADTGWIAEEELGFLESFETRLSTMRLSAGSLHRDPAGGNPRAASLHAGSTPAIPARLQVPKSSLSSPAKSTRSVQSRALAHTHLLKHRWLTQAVDHRCLQQSMATVQEYHKSMRAAPRNDFDFRRPTNLRIKMLMDAKKPPAEDEDSTDEDDG